MHESCGAEQIKYDGEIDNTDHRRNLEITLTSHIVEDFNTLLPLWQAMPQFVSSGFSFNYLNVFHMVGK